MRVFGFTCRAYSGKRRWIPETRLRTSATATLRVEGSVRRGQRAGCSSRSLGGRVPLSKIPGGWRLQVCRPARDRMHDGADFYIGRLRDPHGLDVLVPDEGRPPDRPRRDLPGAVRGGREGEFPTGVPAHQARPRRSRCRMRALRLHGVPFWARTGSAQPGVVDARSATSADGSCLIALR